MQKVLLISNVFPLEKNTSRGCYILAQAELLKSSNFDVKIINPIPFIPPFYSFFDKKFIGFRNISTIRKVNDFDVLHPGYLRFPGSLFPGFNQKNIKSILSKVYNWLEDWIPDIIHLHSIHPILSIGTIISKNIIRNYLLQFMVGILILELKNKNIKQIIKNSTSNIDGVCVVNEKHFSIAKNYSQLKK